MTLKSCLFVAVLIFPVSEIALLILSRASRKTAQVEDRGSLRLLWVVILASVGAAVALQWYPIAPLPLTAAHSNGFALGLLMAGLALRWYAIASLGRLFTVDVALHEDHRLIETGPYKYVRHPSYTGLLLAFLGLGVFFGTWPSVIALAAPITAAVMYRIHREEAALRERFGAVYERYVSRTKRLLPGIL